MAFIDRDTAWEEKFDAIAKMGHSEFMAWVDDIWLEVAAVVKAAIPHQHSYGGGELEDAFDKLKEKL